jgi:hypothetical protein
MASTTAEPIIEQMNAWVRTYAEEYTLSSKIKQIVLNPPAEPRRRDRLLTIAKAGLRKVLASR